MTRMLIVIALVLMLAIGIAIGFFNAQPVTFNYIAGEVQLPLIALVMSELVVVALLTTVLCWTRIFGLKSEIRRLRRQLRDAQAELQSLRNLPYKDVQN